MTPITRKRALEIAQECIQTKLDSIYREWKLGAKNTHTKNLELELHYAELTAALAFFENMARQKELL